MTLRPMMAKHTEEEGEAADDQEALGVEEDEAERQYLDCPGQKPPFLAVKRPARPYKTTIQNRFTMANAKGA